MLKASHIILVLLLFKQIFVCASFDIEEPVGYKLDNYESVTPETLQGAIVIDSKTAKVFHQNNKAVFIDVFPAPKRPASLSDDIIWLPKKRFNILGSIWLANVGFGVLSDKFENHLKLNLQKIVVNNSSKALIFYCNANCWMSWNAAKRAVMAKSK